MVEFAMVMSNEVQVRRSPAYKPLRKPLSFTSTTSPVKTIKDDLVHGLKNKILFLDEDNFRTVGDEVKKELLLSLNEGLLSTSACLVLFLETAWRDRNRYPVLAKVLHDVTQEYDDESDTTLTGHIEKHCNNLLNILTLLGKLEESDLCIVTLLSNLYRVEDLPEEHRDGVESCLIDIAKAFWPYFVPQKHEVWNPELVVDAICDVFQAVGKVLDEKCPVNMKRTFNTITTMLFSMNTISQYTRLRLLEVGEHRAAGWSLSESAKEYYRVAFLKYPKFFRCESSSLSSPSSPSFSSTSYTDDDVFVESSSSTENSPVTTPTSTKTAFLDHPKYDVSVSGKWTTLTEKNSPYPSVIHIKHIHIKQKTKIEEDSVSMNKMNHAKLCSSYEGSPKIPGVESTENSERAKVLTQNQSGLQRPSSCPIAYDLQSVNGYQEGLHSHEDRSSSLSYEGSPKMSEMEVTETSGRAKVSTRKLSGPQRKSSFPIAYSGGFGLPSSPNLQSVNDHQEGLNSCENRSPSYTQGTRNGDGGRFSSWRPKFQSQNSKWKSNLEFPVKDTSILEAEDQNLGSRLYLLSFATTAAAMERPFDLTLTPEIEAEKEWLKCVIVDEPKTVLDRFGQ